MQRGICLVPIAFGLPTVTLAQQFHPTMVEIGVVSPGSPHVTFDPPFPSTPQVVLSVKDFNVEGIHYGCGVFKKNVTSSGFDYAPACSSPVSGPRPVPSNFLATWVATLQQ
jgi:H-type lectin domain